jgi:hypothetical protein
MAVANPAYAVLVTSSIGKALGRSIRGRSREGARLPSGTHLPIRRWTIQPTKFFAAGGYVGSSIMPLASDAVAH